MELSVEKPENIMKLYDENTGLWRFLKTDKGASKSLEIIEKTLYRLGLSKNEIKIYIYVARTGEHKASEISEALSLYRTERALSQIEVPKLQTALGTTLTFFYITNLDV